MNLIGWVILGFLLLGTVLDLAADLLNLKALRLKLPRAFEGLYDERRYEASMRYLRVNTRFGWVASGFHLGVILVFWFSGGFAWLDRWVRTMGLAPVAGGLIYIGLLLVVRGILAMPFGAYATFGIEARFGFNQTTWRTYAADRIKGAALAVLLGGPLLAAVLAFFQYAGAHAWWLCWIAVTLVMVILQYVAPTWIMPLFNRFEPLPPGDLRTAIMAYAQKIDFALENIFIMDGSRRSTKSNAFFTGFGRQRRVVLFDTLVDQHSEAELVAVLAHEMGHYKRRHVLKGLAIGIAQSGLLFFILSLFISYPGLFAAFQVEQVSVYAGLIFFGMLYAPMDGLIGMLLHALSRHHEFEADGFCVDTGGDGTALISALKKLTVANLSNLRPHPFYVFLNYSHPPVLERIEAIERRMAATSSDNGH